MSRRILTVATVALVTLGMWEVAARLLYTRLTPERGRLAVAVVSGEKMPDEMMGVQFHPYVLYANRPGEVRDGFRQHNSLGYRGPEITPQPRAGVIRVLALGGSTTYGHELDDPADAWPARLGKLLTARLGREVEVVNGGLVGALSADLLAHYMFRDRFLGARYVIIHEGGNDAPALFTRHYEPDYSHYRGWIAPSFGRRTGERLLMRSYAARVIYAWWLKSASLAQFEHYPREIRVVPPAEALMNVGRHAPTGFARNIDLLTRNVQDEGAAPILVPFHLAPPGIRARLTPDFWFWRDRYEAFAAGLEKNVAAMKEIAGRRGVPFFRMAPDFIPLDEFFDFCHRRAAGEARVAEFMADRLAPIIRSGEAPGGRAGAEKEHAGREQRQRRAE